MKQPSRCCIPCAQKSVLEYPLHDLGFKMVFQLKLCRLYPNMSENYITYPTIHLRLTVGLPIFRLVGTGACLLVLKFKFAGRKSQRALHIVKEAFFGPALRF